MLVKELMTTDPACCNSETSLQEVAKLMVDNDCGEIPVINEARHPIGVVTDRDIVCRTVAKGINPLDQKAGDCLSQPVVTVTPETSLEECCRIMEEEMIRRVPVVDNSGACIGIVAVADIARQKKQSLTGEVVKEVSTPTAQASGAGA
ncbi:MAG TPA: CBS domain-containing protein [Pyrinomonadaceae bacterium]|nr:CBS domain-containing protein [Pyrinomonadaceae bacterium]